MRSLAAMVVSAAGLYYARSMSTRDLYGHLPEVYGATVLAATISRVTDVGERGDRRLAVPAGRSGVPDPLHRCDPADNRDGGVVANKAAHIVIGVGRRGD